MRSRSSTKITSGLASFLGGGPSYIVHPSDTAPALVALGAQIKIAGPAGEKTMPLEKFFVLPSVDYKRENILNPGEIVTEIHVPTPTTGSKGFYYKMRERMAWDLAIVAVATIVEKANDDTGHAWNSLPPHGGPEMGRDGKRHHAPPA